MSLYDRLMDGDEQTACAWPVMIVRAASTDDAPVANLLAAGCAPDFRSAYGVHGCAQPGVLA